MIISASRRTDIPCYYSEWFLNRLKEGCVMTPNLRNADRLGRVALSPEIVDCIIFWTKNPDPMLNRLSTIDDMGYPYYFEFTITAYGKDMEPNVPSKDAAMETFKKLSDKIGPSRVDWRFDPIIKNQQFTTGWIAEQYERLCSKLHDYTQRCIISFADDYSHLKNRINRMSRSEMKETAGHIATIAREYSLPLFSCSEEIDLSDIGIEHSCCIDQRKIEQLIGARITAKKDAGQRPACGCIESIDIGAYDTCKNGCIYCYATTNPKTVRRRIQAHDPNLPLLTGMPKGTEKITERTKPSQKINQISLFEI